MRTASKTKDTQIPELDLANLQDMIILKGVESNSAPNVVKDPVSSTAVMVPLEFTVKAVRIYDGQRTALLRMIKEAYQLRGSLLRKMERGANPWKMQPWLINTFTVLNGIQEVEKVIKYLDQNMIQYILEDLRKIYDLVKQNKASNKIYQVLNTSEHNCLKLNNYGFSHNFIAPDLLRIMGVDRPIRLNHSEQYASFKSIEYGAVKIQLINDGFYITISCKVSSEELQSQRRHIYKYAFQQHSTQTLKHYEDFTNQARDYRRKQKRQA